MPNVTSSGWECYYVKKNTAVAVYSRGINRRACVDPLVHFDVTRNFEIYFTQLLNPTLSCICAVEIKVRVTSYLYKIIVFDLSLRRNIAPFNFRNVLSSPLSS